MIRDLPGLADRAFDVLIVGGGIYGLTVAYDAAQRGLTVALVDRGDFGAATSFNHLKTIHGGLRYLQSADLARMRESIAERRTFARIAPRFVAPMAFALPTGSSLTRSASALRLALAIDGLVAWDRNEGVAPQLRLPAGRIVTGQECRQLFDHAVPAVSAAAVWHDYVTVNGDRLTLSFAKAASAHGAVLANYVEATAPLMHQGRLTGVQARDVLGDGTFAIRARLVVNAAGPWTIPFLRSAGLSAGWPLLKAMNLVTSRPAGHSAVVASSKAGRALVLLPWNGRALVGTSESAEARQPGEQEARRTEVSRFVDEVNATFRALALSASEVTLVHRGVVPAVALNGGLTLAGHSRVIDHGAEGRPELLSIIGVKYTTARAVAEKVTTLLFDKLGRAAVACRTADSPLPGASLADTEAADPIVTAVREEMAQTLSDVVIRRTGWGATGYPGDAVAQGTANALQRELRWSDERTSRELTVLRQFYEVLES